MKYLLQNAAKTKFSENNKRQLFKTENLQNQSLENARQTSSEVVRNSEINKESKLQEILINKNQTTRANSTVKENPMEESFKSFKKRLDSESKALQERITLT